MELGWLLPRKYLLLSVMSPGKVQYTRADIHTYDIIKVHVQLFVLVIPFIGALQQWKKKDMPLLESRLAWTGT